MAIPVSQTKALFSSLHGFPRKEISKMFPPTASPTSGQRGDKQAVTRPGLCTPGTQGYQVTKHVNVFCYLHVCMCVCAHVCASTRALTCHNMSINVNGFSCSLHRENPQCLNSGSQSWWQAPLPAESSLALVVFLRSGCLAPHPPCLRLPSFGDFYFIFTAFDRALYPRQSVNFLRK